MYLGLQVSFDKCTDTPKWPDVTQPRLCIKAIKQQTRLQTGRRKRQLVLPPANQSVVSILFRQRSNKKLAAQAKHSTQPGE